MPPMTRDDPQMKLRLSPELKERLQESAKAGKRTLNAEITLRLEKSFADDGAESSIAKSLANVAGRLDSIEKALQRIESTAKPQRRK